MKKKSKNKVPIVPPGSSFNLPPASVDYNEILRTRGVIPRVKRQHNLNEMPVGNDGYPKLPGI